MEFETATCTRCNGVASLTQAGWRHGFPPAGHDGHCPGTGLFPTVRSSTTNHETATATVGDQQVTARSIFTTFTEAGEDVGAASAFFWPNGRLTLIASIDDGHATGTGTVRV